MEENNGAVQVKFDVRLVEKVREHPVIYDSKDENYKNRNFKDEIWKSIGQDLGYIGDDCQYRWRVIRDRYVKKKKEMLRKPGVPEDKIVSSWTLFYQVDDFLSPYIVHRHRLTPQYDEMPIYFKEEDSASPQIPVLDEGSTPPYVSFESALDESVDNNDGNGETRPPKLSHYNSDLDVSFIGADGSLRALPSSRKRRAAIGIKDEEIHVKQFLNSGGFSLDEETHFGCIVTSTLKRLEPKQRALAKLKLTELLYKLEFPEESPIQIDTNKSNGNE
ncbi:hypothetical protein LOTGIDRAFT_229638 [Lottia gigantea]|uniref:MADF domain-containing protein n=1 Tax=Lottia gigantea TaxID=225164 RepID=V3Z0X0_LOTGI|nr:hypothetical protein LOTGIDRAFT_229638 [Lottia gigantea]ESO84168.1 hypothetical protein LOTGIDRAFT_229638 [Lottia gigantea]